MAARLGLVYFVAVAVHQPQVLACGPHGHVLPLELELLCGALLALEEHPGAVDGPVAQGAVAGEVEGAGREGMGEVVADGGCGFGLAFHFF